MSNNAKTATSPSSLACKVSDSTRRVAVSVENRGRYAQTFDKVVDCSTTDNQPITLRRAVQAMQSNVGSHWLRILFTIAMLSIKEQRNSYHCNFYESRSLLDIGSGSTRTRRGSARQRRHGSQISQAY